MIFVFIVFLNKTEIKGLITLIIFFVYIRLNNKYKPFSNKTNNDLDEI